jgi:hypothetical protein
MALPAIAAALAGARFLGPLMGRRIAGKAAGATAAAATKTPKQRALGKSFGAIMSGQTSLQDAEERERQEQKNQEAKEKGKQALQKFTRAALGSVVALFGMPKAIQKFGEAMAARNAQLAEYGGQIAAASQKLQADRIGRQAELARRTGESAEAQMASQSRLENALAPWKAAGRNIGNRISQGMNNLAANIVEGVNKLPIIGEWLKWLAGEDQKAQNVPFIDFMADVAEGKWQPGEKKRRNNGGVNRPL